MLLEAAVVLCLTNATDSAVFGLVRDGRFKTTSAKLSGTSLTYREPVAQTPFPAVAAGQTGCATIDALTLAKPRWWCGRASLRPRRATSSSTSTATPSAARPRTHASGQRLTFVYRKSLFGQLTCKETR
jgi:hypothetical protein